MRIDVPPPGYLTGQELSDFYIRSNCETGHLALLSMLLLRRFAELRKAHLLRAWRLAAERTRLWRQETRSAVLKAWRGGASVAREVRHTAASLQKPLPSKLDITRPIKQPQVFPEKMPRWQQVTLL